MKCRTVEAGPGARSARPTGSECLYFRYFVCLTVYPQNCWSNAKIDLCEIRYSGVVLWQWYLKKFVCFFFLISDLNLQSFTLFLIVESKAKLFFSSSSSPRWASCVRVDILIINLSEMSPILAPQLGAAVSRQSCCLEAAFNWRVSLIWKN